MFFSRKQWLCRWKKYDDIRNGKDSVSWSTIKITYELIDSSNGLLSIMLKLQRLQKYRPEIFEDHDLTALSVPVGISFVDWSSIFLNDLLDAASYGLDALGERTDLQKAIGPLKKTGGRHPSDATLFVMHEMYSLSRAENATPDLLWKAFGLTDLPRTRATLKSIIGIIDLVSSYTPRHREIYDAYLNGQLKDAEYEKRRDAMFSEIVIRLYRLYDIDLETWKLIAPKDFDKCFWADGTQGNFEDYLKRHREIVARADKAHHYLMNLTGDSFVFEKATYKKVIGVEECTEEEAYQIKERGASYSLDYVWDFVREAKGSRGNAFEHIRKYHDGPKTEEIFNTRLCSAAGSYLIAKHSIRSLYLDDFLCVTKLNPAYGKDYSIFDTIRKKTAAGTDTPLYTMPGEEHLYPPDFPGILMDILEKHLPESRRVFEEDGGNKAARNAIAADCMKDLCDSYHLDWYHVMELYPEATAEARKNKEVTMEEVLNFSL